MTDSSKSFCDWGCTCFNFSLTSIVFISFFSNLKYCTDFRTFFFFLYIFIEVFLLYFRNDGNNAENEENESPEKKNVLTQTEDNVISCLLSSNDTLSQQISKLQLRLNNIIFRYDQMAHKDVFKNITGFDKKHFDVVFSFLMLEESLPKDCFLNQKDQFFLLLVYLRTGIPQVILAHMFETTQSSVSKICARVTDIIYDKVKQISIWPSKKTVQQKMPLAFFKIYPECRVIIDCTEFQIQRPVNPVLQQASFSFYKNCNTLKGMVGITPSGAISFISNLWSGSISDKELFLKSGLLNLLEKNDLVLADRGFLIGKELAKKECRLITPHYLANKIQFSDEEKTENKCVSHHRVHIERAIGRIKSYKYFEGMIPNCSLNTVNKYFYIIAFFINFGSRLFQPK